MKSPLVLLILFLILISNVSSRRGRGRGRKGGGVGRVTMPLGGKWRDPDAAKYYTNANGAKITKASHFDLDYLLGHKIVFICFAIGNPRPEITWYKDGIEIYGHHLLQIHEWSIDDDKIKSKMEIDPATQRDAGIYECFANNKYSVDKRTFRTDFITNFD